MFEPFIIPDGIPAPLAQKFRDIDELMTRRGREFIASTTVESVDTMLGSDEDRAEMRFALTVDPRPMMARQWGWLKRGATYTHCYRYARLLEEQIAARQTEKEAA